MEVYFFPILHSDHGSGSSCFHSDYWVAQIWAERFEDRLEIGQKGDQEKTECRVLVVGSKLGELTDAKLSEWV